MLMDSATSSRTLALSRRRRLSPCLDGGQQVLGLVLLDGDVRIPGDPERRLRRGSRRPGRAPAGGPRSPPRWRTKRSSPGSRQEAGEERRDLDPGEAVLLGAGIAHHGGQVERQVRDERKRVGGIDGQWRQHGEDLLVEHAGRPGQVFLRQCSPSGTASTPASVRAGASCLAEDLVSGDRRSARSRRGSPWSCSPGVRPSGVTAPTPGLQLGLQSGHTNLKELVEVPAGNGQELDSFEQPGDPHPRPATGPAS